MEQLTLFELNNLIKATLDKNLQPSYWVVAEIGEMRMNQSGHCYLELVEKEENKVVAKTRATIWSYTYRNLSTWFEGMTGESLRSGLKILCNVAIQFHELYGMSVNIKDIDANFTIGERARIRKEVINQLIKDGVYEMNKELSLPLVPQRIAVISSPTAAGFGDFMDQIEGNSYGYQLNIQLFKAIMQGEKAPDSIINAIHQVHQLQNNFDLLVIIRGGGSQIDLDCFDNYDIASHIAQFSLPVITGIGHERDESVADLVAHTQMKTPTAVAEFLISGINAYEKKMEEAFNLIYNYAYQKFVNFEQTLENTSLRLKSATNSVIQHGSFELDHLKNQLTNSTKRTMASQEERLLIAEKSIKLLDPETILKRGYSLTLVDGKPFTGKQLSKGDSIRTLTQELDIKSTVEESKPRK